MIWGIRCNSAGLDNPFLNTCLVAHLIEVVGSYPAYFVGDLRSTLLAADPARRIRSMVAMSRRGCRYLRNTAGVIRARYICGTVLWATLRRLAQAVNCDEGDA